MKLKKFDYLMILVVVVAALIPLTILFCGKIDRERLEQQQQELGIDSLRAMHRRLPRHDPREDSLRTREDSIHFYEDGM